MTSPHQKLKEVARDLESLASRLQSGAAGGDEAAATLRRHARDLRELAGT
jgi:hypothetical protein